MNWLHLIKQGENEKTEFKTSFNTEVIETLVAFANSKGGAVMVGVANDKRIVGASLQEESIQNWINEVKNKTVPSIIPDVELIEVELKNIIIFSTPEYPVKPVSYKGKYFKRVKNSNQQLLVSEVVNLHLQSLNTSWDAYPDNHHHLDAISFDKVQQSIEVLKNRNFTINESPLAFLRKYDLIREDKPTHAAYLLFKQNDSIATTIELGGFQDPITIKDTSRTKTDIITQVEDVIGYVKKHINVALIISGATQNQQKWQYPLEAIREIVLNMIIHRDYRSNSDAVVKIFDDKIEFFNPGKLPDDITIQDLLDNNYKSTPRNKTIAEFFKNLGWIEKYGSGIGRIINFFRESRLPPPTFQNQSGGFLVTIFANKTPNDTLNDTLKDTLNDTLNNREQIIKQMILKNKDVTQEEIAEKCDISLETIKRDMNKMQKANIIKRIGSKKTGHWHINKFD
jgi:ATP-dependent DNA helicase RecG